MHAPGVEDRTQYYEFQAIIMAHNTKNEMHGLLGKTPPFLLPFANRPIITYPLQLLELHGIVDIIIVVYEKYVEALSDFLSQYRRLESEPDQIKIVKVDEEDLGEVEVLKIIKDEIKV